MQSVTDQLRDDDLAAESDTENQAGKQHRAVKATFAETTNVEEGDYELGRLRMKDQDSVYNQVHVALKSQPIWRLFLPAMIVYPMWLYAMSKRSAFEEAFSEYYPLTIAMIGGSMVAGSTPLGGGVVAFPVAVLFIKFKPEQGRDFSLIIQAVGMSAASFLIIYAKRDLCHFWIILWFILSSMIGMIAGFEIEMSPFVVNITFTTAVACFALSYSYSNLVARPNQKMTTTTNTKQKTPKDPWKILQPGRFDLTEAYMYRLLGRFFPLALTLCACMFGMIGGFLTSKLGSGADMMAFLFGAFVWNVCVPEGAELSDNMLTASSVLIMAACSIIGTILRQLHAKPISTEVILCWGACVPIVVLGAPLGSLLLTPTLAEALRRCFYVLSMVQLATFGALKVKDNTIAWIGVAAAMVSVSLMLLLHFLFVVRKRSQNSKQAENSECP